MAKKNLIVLSLIFMVMGFFSYALPQAQTGSIRGAVYEEQKNLLPGVTITLTSPSLLGAQSFVTSNSGEFRFPACPPGTYAIKAEISGFQTMEKSGIIVHVGMSVEINFELKPATLNESVTVTAASPMIDTQSPKLATKVTNDMITNIPLQREVYEVAKLAAGIVDEGPAADTNRKGLSVHGGTIYQTVYAVDGVSLADPYYGYITKDISFDAIDEAEIMTGGLPAEIGYSSAGYVNVVSKSGGNRLSGGLSLQYNGEPTQIPAEPDNFVAAYGLAKIVADRYVLDGALDIGGPILKDKIWFFANPRLKSSARTSPFIPFTDPQGVYHPAHEVKALYDIEFLKLTAQITNRLKFMTMGERVNMNADPDFGQIGPKRSYDANSNWTDRGTHLSNVLSYVINQDTFTEARLGYIKRWQNILDNGERVTGKPQARYYDRYTGYYWNSYGNNQYYDRWRWNASLKFVRYQDKLFGVNHEFKAGLDYSRNQTIQDPSHLMPVSYNWYNGTPWNYQDTTPYKGSFSASTRSLRLGDSPKTDQFWVLGGFIQDTFTIARRLTLNLGLRYDSSHGSRPLERQKGWVDTNFNGLLNILLPDVFTTQDLVTPALNNIINWSSLQPRVGLTFDIFGDAKTMLKASFSRYAEAYTTVWMGVLHPFGSSASFDWWDDNRNGLFDLPPIDRYFATSIPLIVTDPAALRQQIDSNQTSPYTDEISAGIEHEFNPVFSLGLNFTYRDNRNINETLDLNNPLGGDMWLPYTVTDPGNDGKFGTGDDAPITVYAQKKDALPVKRYLTNVPGVKRRYLGTELSLMKRMSDNWQLSASITYSKAYGNLGGDAWDTSITGLYTNPNNLINAWGRTTWDRPLMIKIMGTVKLPYGFIASGYYRYSTGTAYEDWGRANLSRTLTVYFPATVNGFAPKTSSVTVKAEPPGTVRGKDTDILDVRLEKEFPVGRLWRLGVFVDVFNVLGYSRLYVDLNKGGYIYADGSFSRNPNYGQRLAIFEGTRTAKFSMRFSF